MANKLRENYFSSNEEELKNIPLQRLTTLHRRRLLLCVLAMIFLFGYLLLQHSSGFSIHPLYWILPIIVIPLSFVLVLRTRLQKERQLLNLEIAKYTSQIAESKLLIEEQASRLRQIDLGRKHFLTNITHEIRTPLTLILGPAEQMLNNGLPKKYKSELRLIKDNAEYLMGTVNQLLDLSKAESGSMQKNYFLGDIISFAKELVNRFEHLAQQKELQLTFKSDLTNWETCFDKEKLNKIIYNLVANAIKFTPAKGQVTVHIHKEIKGIKEYIVLSVEDTGIGISTEHTPKLFDRFYQVNNKMDSPKKESSGIGLSLVKELVTFLDGTIDINSELGTGSIFSVMIPILSPSIKKEIDKVTSSHLITVPNIEDPKEISSTNKFEVLLIEDNPDMRSFIRRSIDNKGRYNIREAANGEEGLKLAMTQIPDIVISDVMMPIKNGYEVIKAIRSNMHTSHIPVILLTAKESKESQLRALEYGVDAYLTKPFNAKELNLRVEKLLENRALLKQRFQINNTQNPKKEMVQFGFEQDEQFLTTIQNIIEEHLDETALNGDFISKQIGMSRMSLHRKLKSITNQSATKFIREYRLQKAYQWLQEGKDDISNISYQVGFSASGYFSKLFKERFGLSPSQVVKDRKIKKKSLNLQNKTQTTN